MVLVFLALIAVVAATTYPEAPPIFEALPHTTWRKLRHEQSRVGDIQIPFTGEDGSADQVSMIRLDLVGDAKARGFAHGFLLSKEILKFVQVDLNKYFADMVLNMNFDTSGLPKALQDILEVVKIKGAAAAPKAFTEAMTWVYEKEEQYMPQYLIDEMEGIGEGMCAATPETSGCNATERIAMIKSVNMLPELIRMACTAFGAWGKANSLKNNGTLVQLRALDFGTGPFVNHSVIATYREPGQRAFVSVSFPGFVGVITGVAQEGVGISEKVWMTYDSPTSLQPGHYDGEPDVFVLRDLLQKSKNRAEAEAYVKEVKRTFAIWIGVGDFETQQLDLIGYMEDSATVYTDETMPPMNGQPFLEDVCYVDKHPQPSGEGATGTLPTFLTDFYGDISMENTRIGVRYHQTGDVHIAAYDFGNNKMIVSIGRIDENGQYGPEGGDKNQWKAYNRPYVQFDLNDLWNGK